MRWYINDESIVSISKSRKENRRFKSFEEIADKFLNAILFVWSTFSSQLQVIHSYIYLLMVQHSSIVLLMDTDEREFFKKVIAASVCVCVCDDYGFYSICWETNIYLMAFYFACKKTIRRWFYMNNECKGSDGSYFDFFLSPSLFLL